MSDQDSPRSDDEDRTPVSPTTHDESQRSWTSSYRAWMGSEEAGEYFEAEDRSIPASQVSCSSSYREWMNSAEGSEFFLEDSPLQLEEPTPENLTTTNSEDSDTSNGSREAKIHADRRAVSSYPHYAGGINTRTQAPASEPISAAWRGHTSYTDDEEDSDDQFPFVMGVLSSGMNRLSFRQRSWKPTFLP